MEEEEDYECQGLVEDEDGDIHINNLITDEPELYLKRDNGLYEELRSGQMYTKEQLQEYLDYYARNKEYTEDERRRHRENQEWIADERARNEKRYQERREQREREIREKELKAKRDEERWRRLQGI